MLSKIKWNKIEKEPICQGCFDKKAEYEYYYRKGFHKIEANLCTKCLHLELHSKNVRIGGN